MSGGELTFRRVLVVDDEVAVVRTLRRVLERSGREVVSAGSVDEGLVLLRDEPVDLVITDVHLGAGSGVDVARAAADKLPAPPVIAITGLATAADGLQLGKAGVSALLPKPFTGRELIATIEGIEPPRQFELDAVIRRCVGDRPMPEVLDGVRRSMVLEALARTSNNKAQAAGLLGISRQHLQQILSRGKI